MSSIFILDFKNVICYSTDMELHTIFRFARETQNIKQSHLAKRAGIAQPSLANYERGHSTLSEKTLIALAPIINIDPKYIRAESGNPFFSKELIKMFFPESVISGMDYGPLEFLLKVNSTLEVIFLRATSKSKTFEKIISNTIIGPMTIAVLVRDQDGNTFILRRKTRGARLVGEDAIQEKLSRLAKEDKKEVVFQSKRITSDLTGKIKDWTVEKKDVESLFSETRKIELTAEEIELIEQIRAQGVNPKTLRRHLNKDRLDDTSSCKKG